MSWDQKRIRRTFLDYFVQRKGLEHREVPSSPIIPRDDPTLLFTNAGMNQFKATLLGQEKRDYTRACSVQKCMRVGGKHNDLDAVGKDGRHLTWFEMLGNWSFGDYYKKEAINLAWDLSVNAYGLDPNRIYASIYKDDEEAYELWLSMIGLPPERIFRFGDVERGDEENFWSMGPTGPCGPCSELFYDLGPEAGTGPDDVMGGEGDRFMEYWNNVFMEFNRADDGTQTPLAMQSVDTGMGMERITMILQGKISVYETDLFVPIIRETARLIRQDPTHADHKVHFQVIADHLRSLTFVLSEGGRFSNEGRGYVLRRILRRAVRHGRLLGFDGPFLWRLVPVIGELFEGVYELPAHILDNTSLALREEEERFFATIDRGLVRIEEMIKSKAASGDGPSARSITGQEAFVLHDTFGFPVDLTGIVAAEHGFTVDEPGFVRAMEVQRQRSRAAGQFYEDAGGEWVELAEGSGQIFAGYGLTSIETRVVRFRQVQGTGEAAGTVRVELVLHETPLYAESGGETGDHGEIRGPGFVVEITDVQKINGIIHHMGHLKSGHLAEIGADTRVTAWVDVDYRAKKRVHHTATHLLHAALKHVLGAHVEQKGSVVDPNRLRFDFSHGAAVTRAQLDAAEAWVNERIRANEGVVTTEDVPIKEALAEGVVALFGEKYGDHVRTVRAGADSFELCGGNHVERTGDIGYCVVMSEGAVAAGVRRLEAVVGHSAEEIIRKERGALRSAASALKADIEQVPTRIEALQVELRTLRKSLDKARRTGGRVDADTLLAAQVDVAGAAVVAARLDVDDRETLAAIVDRIRDKEPRAVIVVGAELDGKAALVAGVGSAHKGKGRFHAGRIIKAVAERVDGRGGGRPDFAQAGGNTPAKLDGAIADVPTIVAEQAG